MNARAHCTGAIIAGGRATRFGGVAKGLELVGGVRMIDRVAEALWSACDDVVLIANDPAAARWIPGLRVIPDIHTGTGALGGIHAALSAAAGAVMAVGWDSPFVPAGLLRALRNAGDAEGVEAVVPISNSPWGFEPLCAWYAQACLVAIERQIGAHDLRAGAWQQEVNTFHLDVSPWGSPDEIFFNVNSAEDLAIANAKPPRAS